MKNSFLGYYRPTDSEFTILWDNCIFSFDANVLLNLYRYSTSTCDELLNILDKISDRLWLPFQVGQEYQENRLEVIQKQRNAYGDIQKYIVQTQGNIESYFGNYIKHPFLKVKSIVDKINSLFSGIIKELKDQEVGHPDLIAYDTLRDRITMLFNGKLGGAYTLERLKNIYEEGEKRYEKRIPPGFSDSERKKGENKYGDLVLWFQLIEKAKEEQKPFIFITDETKEDWWWIFRGRTIGPRPELIKEFYSKTNQNIYIYSSDQFMEYVRQYLQKDVEETAISEVRELRKTDFSASLLLHAISFVKINEDNIKEIASKIISLRQEQDIYDEHRHVIQNEITSIDKKLQILKSSADQSEYGNVNELLSRLRYLKRELNSIEDNYENIATKIDILKSQEASERRFIDLVSKNIDLNNV